MGGLLGSLNIAETSLSTNQKSVEVIGNNVANANTPGYSRETPVLTPYPTVNFNGFMVGEGVKVSDIQRSHDVFLAGQIQAQSNTMGEQSAKSSPLSDLEQIFNTGDNNLATQVNSFFDSWQQLATNPSGEVERNAVIQQGNLLANGFHSTITQLNTAQNNINLTISSKIKDINSKLQQIADLNVQIASVQTSGHTANSFLDQRDQLLQQLSQSLGVKSYEDANGMVSVQLPTGLPLVSGNTAFSLAGFNQNGNVQLKVQQGGGSSVNVDMSHLGGEFKGLLDVRDQLIPELRSNLDQMAYSLTTAVNAQQQAGVGLDGKTHPFFTALSGQSGAAENIGVAIQDSSQVAAGATSAPGDNTNAQKIADLAQSKVVNGEDTLTDYYSKMTSTVGTASDQNQLALTGAQDSLTQLQNLRDSSDGVSIDQEMTDLIQYQQGFQASAKFMTTVNQMMDSILSIQP